jgi:hypothetical protein
MTYTFCISTTVMQGKQIEIDNLKHCIYCRVNDPWLVVRIPQQKALHLTGIYLDHSTAEQGPTIR